ncbi:OTU domain-containing protein 3 isoform X1 [Cherax quadricarinatus]|uniref:OTU domain-containing protein 3 isoform X1 n=1 Tax=Cherax quadricarinatus TaxID=27406 RepID=UPI00387EABBA
MVYHTPASTTLSLNTGACVEAQVRKLTAGDFSLRGTVGRELGCTLTPQSTIMARKREERALRNAQRAARKARATQGGQDPSFVSLKQQLEAMGLKLKEIAGDGNCLFGALGDQLDGVPTFHQKHRQDVVAYMRQHRNDFEPFVEDDVPFDRHLSNLAELGTYAGNDCIVAFARLHEVVVVIHQLNAPLWQICGREGKKNMPELHISYHNGDHYNSVRKINDHNSSSPACIKLSVQDSEDGKDKKKNGSKSSDKEYTSDYPEDYSQDYASEEYTWSGEGYDYSEPVYEGLSKAEHMVMDQTGCEDLHLIRKQLEAHDFDVHEAINSILTFFVLQYKGEYPQTTSNSSNSLWSPNGTGTRLFGETAAAPLVPAIHPSYQKKTPQEKIQQRLRTQQHISNSKRKELKKQLRKQQAHERKRHQAAHDTDDVTSNSNDESEVIIVKDIGCLSI